MASVYYIQAGGPFLLGQVNNSPHLPHWRCGSRLLRDIGTLITQTLKYTLLGLLLEHWAGWRMGGSVEWEKLDLSSNLASGVLTVCP